MESTPQYLTDTPIEFQRAFSDKVVATKYSSYKARGKSWLAGSIKAGTSALYPGVLQGDKRFADKKVFVYKEVKKWLEQEPFSEENAGGWKSVLTDCAYPATIAPYAPEDNSDIRKQYGLRSPTTEEEAEFRQLVRLIVTEAKLRPVAHNSSSSSGAPFFIRGATYKKEKIKEIYNAKAFPGFSAAIASRDWLRMLEYDVLPVYTQGTRKHPIAADFDGDTAVPLKEREYQTQKQIMNCEHERTAVDFTHPVDSRLVTYDIRSMYAANSIANFANQILNNAMMYGFKKVADVVCYSGEVELEAQLKSRISILKQKGTKYRILSLDKRKFGETFCPRLIEIFIDEMWKTGFKEIMPIVEAMIAWPTLYRSIERDLHEPFLSSKLEDLPRLTGHKAAFKSGNGLVALFGRLLGTFDAWLIAKKLVRGIKMKEFLNNEYEDLFVKNSGDDTLWLLVESLADKFESALQNSLHADEVEELALFLGYYYKQDGSATVDVGKFLMHMNCHERGFNSKSAPRSGILARIAIYSKNPYFLRAFAIEKQSLLDFCGFDLDAYLTEDDPVSEKLLAYAKSMDDYAFIANPDLLHYKPAIAERVAPEIISHFYSFTEPEEYADIFSDPSIKQVS